jgi:hypothetical protein
MISVRVMPMHHSSKPYQFILVQRPDKLRANQPDPYKPNNSATTIRAKKKGFNDTLYDLILLRKDPTGSGV